MRVEDDRFEGSGTLFAWLLLTCTLTTKKKKHSYAPSLRHQTARTGKKGTDSNTIIFFLEYFDAVRFQMHQ